MNKAKKLYVIATIMFLIATNLPNVTQAKLIYGYTLARLSEPVNGVYIVVYEKIGYEKDIVILREIHARRCYKTPTVFKTTETDDPLITLGHFTYNDTEYLIKDLATLTINDKVYVFTVVNDTQSKNVSFFATYTNDTGFTWIDMEIITNTTVSDTNYKNFDVTYFNNKILLAYSYRIVKKNYTQVITINPQTLKVEDKTSVSNYFGDDFKLFTYENKMYLVSTDPDNGKVVRFTYSADGYNLSNIVTTIQPPYSNITSFNPTIIRWNNGFYIIGVDQHWGIVQHKALGEYFLWGRWIKDVGQNDTISNYNVLGNKDFDGYYQRDPSASTYAGNIFVVFEEGRSITTGLPNMNFLFSSDASLWLHEYSGSQSLIANPGIIFAVATVACFAIALPINFYIEKRKKK